MSALRRVDAFFNRAMGPSDRFFTTATRHWTAHVGQPFSEEQKEEFRAAYKREIKLLYLSSPLLCAAIAINILLPDTPAKYVVVGVVMAGYFAALVVRQVWAHRRRKLLRRTPA